MGKLANTFAAGGVGLFLAGCTTTMDGSCMGGVSVGNGLLSNRSFSTACADNQAANSFIKSGDRSLKLVGATMLRKQSRAVDEAIRDVLAGKGGPAPREEKQDCVVVAVREEKSKGKGKGQFEMACGPNADLAREKTQHKPNPDASKKAAPAKGNVPSV